MVFELIIHWIHSLIDIHENLGSSDFIQYTARSYIKSKNQTNGTTIGVFIDLIVEIFKLEWTWVVGSGLMNYFNWDWRCFLYTPAQGWTIL